MIDNMSKSQKEYYKGIDNFNMRMVFASDDWNV
jgi:hypothetical protein